MWRKNINFLCRATALALLSLWGTPANALNISPATAPDLASAEVMLNVHVHASVGYIQGMPQTFDIVMTAGFDTPGRLEDWFGYYDDAAAGSLIGDRLVFDADMSKAEVFTGADILDYFQGPGPLYFNGLFKIGYNYPGYNFERYINYSLEVRYSYENVPDPATTVHLIAGMCLCLVALRWWQRG